MSNTRGGLITLDARSPGRYANLSPGVTLAAAFPVARVEINGSGALARQFGVSQQLIGMIVRREIWRHVA